MGLDAQLTLMLLMCCCTLRFRNLTPLVGLLIQGFLLVVNAVRMHAVHCPDKLLHAVTAQISCNKSF